MFQQSCHTSLSGDLLSCDRLAVFDTVALPSGMVVSGHPSAGAFALRTGTAWRGQEQVSSQAQTAASTAGGQHLLTLLVEPTDQLSEALHGVDEWQYDSFKLDAASQGRPLSCLAFHLMTRMDLIKMFNLNKDKLARFLVRIEQGYPTGIYHSRIHAADVLRSLHVLLTRGGVLGALAACVRAQQRDQAHGSRAGSQPNSNSGFIGAAAAGDGKVAVPGVEASRVFMFKLLASYLAAIIHDFDHRGVTNDFLIRSGHPLAVLYNDSSPQENHHVAAAFQLLGKEQYSFLPQQSKHRRSLGPDPPSGRRLHDVLRKEVIELVLSTDMRMHFLTMSSFAAKVVHPKQVAMRRETSGGMAPGAARTDSQNGSPGSPSRMITPALAPIAIGRMGIRKSEDRERMGAEGTPDSLAGLTPTTGTAALELLRNPRKINSARAMCTEAGGAKRTSGGSPLSPMLSVPPPIRTCSGAGYSKLERTGGGVRAAVNAAGGGAGAQADDPQRLSLPELPGVPGTPGNGTPASTVEGAGTPLAGSRRRASLLYLTCSGACGGEGTATSANGVRSPSWDSETQMLILKVALKCADLGHLTGSTGVHKQWVGLLEEEMFRQGDRERAMGHPISPLMDRTKGGVTKSQCGFFNLIAIPMFSAFSEVFSDTQPVFENLKANYTMWSEEEAKHAEQATPAASAD